VNSSPNDASGDETAVHAFEAARVRHLRADLARTPTERIIRLEELIAEVDAMHGKQSAPSGTLFATFEEFNTYKASRQIVRLKTEG
jgi:hypothetical protein